MKKYEIIIFDDERQKKFVSSKKPVVIFYLKPSEKRIKIDQDDIDIFFLNLKLDPTIADNPWVGAEAYGFCSNESYDLFFFFTPEDEFLRFCIVCKTQRNKLKVLKILNELRELEQNQILMEQI